MNSEPRFWNGKSRPIFAASVFGVAFRQAACVTSQFQGKKTHTTIAAAPKMTVQRQRITQSMTG